MEKSIFTTEYAVLLQLLRDTRKSAGVSQKQLADRLAVGQSLVSKWERAEARLDVVQLRTICQALETDLQTFINRYEKRIASGRKQRGRKRG